MLTDKQLFEIAENKRPKYLYFENFKKGTPVFDGILNEPAAEDYQAFECTKCGGTWFESGFRHKHKEEAVCPHCENTVSAYNLQFGRKTFRTRMNAVILYAEDYDTVRAECVVFRFENFTDIYSPCCSFERRMLYTFTPNGSERLNQYSRPIKKKSGYKFYIGMQTINCRPEEYEIFWEGTVPKEETFLKYSRFRDYPEDRISGGTLTYLCGYCEMPALYELLMRTNRAALKALCEEEKKITQKINRRAKTFKELFPKHSKEKISEIVKLLKRRGEIDELFADDFTVRRINTAVDYLSAHTVDEYYKALELFQNDLDTADKILKATGQSPVTLSNYLKKQKAEIGIYRDYIDECKKLGYDLSDGAVLYPKDLREKHTETSGLVYEIQYQKAKQKRSNRYNQLVKAGAEYKHKRLMSVVPKNAAEIVHEGAVQSSCVAGYAERHERGATTIIFIRRCKEPEKAYFTLELNMKTGAVRQCYGYKNRVSYRNNLEVEQFLEHYQRHLKYCRKHKNAKKVRKTA